VPITPKAGAVGANPAVWSALQTVELAAAIPPATRTLAEVNRQVAKDFAQPLLPAVVDRRQGRGSPPTSERHARPTLKRPGFSSAFFGENDIRRSGWPTPATASTPECHSEESHHGP
jgi:hypothetical protein